MDNLSERTGPHKLRTVTWNEALLNQARKQGVASPQDPGEQLLRTRQCVRPYAVCAWRRGGVTPPYRVQQKDLACFTVPLRVSVLWCRRPAYTAPAQAGRLHHKTDSVCRMVYGSWRARLLPSRSRPARQVFCHLVL